MSYEGFKDTKIGLIPEDWEVGVFNTDLKVKGRIGWRGYKRSDLVDSGPLVLGGSNINSNFFLDLADIKFLKREKYEESPEIMLKKGDVLLVTRGNLGEVGYFDGSIKEATINPSVVILSEFKGNPKFLFYYLISNYGKWSVLSISSGSSVPAIYQADVKKLRYPKPPILEQKEIIKILSSIDKKIHLNHQMNQTLEEIGQAIFRHWFVHFEFPTSEGQPYKSSGGEMVDSDFGDIPVGWEVKKLKIICNITMGQSPKSEFYNEEGKGLPFHQGVTNFGERFPKDKMYCTVENKIAEYEDILFSVRAPVGRINIAKSKMVIGRGLSAIRHKNDFQSFLLYQLKNIFTKEDSIGSGTVFNAITRKDLDDLNVLVPNDELDKRFNDFMNPMEKLIENLILESENLSQIRDSLLPKLMSGKIRVTPKKEATAK